MTETNPLSQYFRVPGMHVKLPSNGNFGKPEDFDLSISGEVAVLPMTGKDEIWSKNPDGLLNGYSIEHIIRSCVPGVKNPRALPMQDVDYLLLAIKKVTYGNTMKLGTRCPKCKEHHEYECRIDDLLATSKNLPEPISVRLNEVLVAKIRPHDFSDSTRTNMAAFEEAKLLQNLLTVGLSEELRMRTFGNSFEKISTLNLELIANCIMMIISPEGEITDRQHINEFVQNSSKDVIEKLKENIALYSEYGIDRTIALKCPREECLHEWESEAEFDPSRFFE